MEKLYFEFEFWQIKDYISSLSDEDKYHYLLNLKKYLKEMLIDSKYKPINYIDRGPDGYYSCLLVDEVWIDEDRMIQYFKDNSYAKQLKENVNIHPTEYIRSLIQDDLNSLIEKVDNEISFLKTAPVKNVTKSSSHDKIRWNRSLELLSYLFECLMDKELINPDLYSKKNSKVISEHFEDKNGNPIKPRTLSSTKFNYLQRSGQPKDAAIIDKIISKVLTKEKED